jgi:uncharacterized membrane protein
MDLPKYWQVNVFRLFTVIGVWFLLALFIYVVRGIRTMRREDFEAAAKSFRQSAAFWGRHAS